MLKKYGKTLDSIPVEWLKSVPTPLFILDEGGLILWCNDTFVELTGYSREGLVGARLDRLFGQDHIAKMIEDIMLLYKGQRFASHPYDLMRESGRTIHVTMDLTPIFDKGSQTVTHVFGVIRTHYALG